jgi:hypothetical protein
VTPNGRNAGRLFPDCTNLYGYGEWHRLRTLDRQWLRKLLRLRTMECVHCHRRFKDSEITVEGEPKRLRRAAERQRGSRRGLPRLPR